MKQYFEVGEEVILCSEDYPELNGDYVIFNIVHGDMAYKDPLVEEMLTSRGCGIAYLLDGLTDMEIGMETHIPWEQSALRKKHQPGEDHSTFMDNLFKIEAPA